MSGYLMADEGRGMPLTTVRCPACGRGFVLNGAGICKCGAYLVHHWHGRRKIIKYPDRAWIFVEGEWQPWQAMHPTT